ncbi:hypothetical protein [Streptomyces sp. CA-243310]|uniref:hypothetical protein n=1 Tax=Streptomyces sp. CA-243310 TaxID=3240056 RepID=UPI003D8B0FB4
MAGMTSWWWMSAHAFPADPDVRCASSTTTRSKTSIGNPYAPSCASASTGRDA